MEYSCTTLENASLQTSTSNAAQIYLVCLGGRDGLDAELRTHDLNDVDEELEGAATSDIIMRYE